MVAFIWIILNFAGDNRLIKNIDIKIQKDSALHFLTDADILYIVQGQSGNLLQKTAQDINLTKIETALKNSPYVREAQVYLSLDGTLKVQVKPRIAVVRIANVSGETYFLDSAGMKMPYKSTVIVDVPVANGAITEKIKDGPKIKQTALVQILQISKYIKADAFWDAQFEQLYVDNFGDIILIPRVGGHRIVVGNAENLPEKFRNLRIFYEKGIKSIGWDTYKTLNLKYKGQVVGERNKPINEHKPSTTVQQNEH